MCSFKYLRLPLASVFQPVRPLLLCIDCASKCNHIDLFQIEEIFGKALCDVRLISVAILRRRGGMSGMGWSLQIANLFLAFVLPVWPQNVLQGYGGFCGKTALCTSTSFLCPVWESLRGPWHALQETPQWIRNRAVLHRLNRCCVLKPVSFLELLDQLGGTKLSLQAQSQMRRSLLRRAMFFFIFSSSHHVTTGAKGSTNHTSRE